MFAGVVLQELEVRCVYFRMSLWNGIGPPTLQLDLCMSAPNFVKVRRPVAKLCLCRTVIPQHLFPITFPHTAHVSLLHTLRMLGLFIPDPINTQSLWTSGDWLEVCGWVFTLFHMHSSSGAPAERQFLFSFLVLCFKYFGFLNLRMENWSHGSSSEWKFPPWKLWWFLGMAGFCCVWIPNCRS